MAEYCQYIRGLRLRAGLSQNGAARKAGFDPAFLNRVELSGKYMGRDLMLSLLEAYEASPYERDRALWLGGHAPVIDWQTAYQAMRTNTVERFNEFFSEVHSEALASARSDARTDPPDRARMEDTREHPQRTP